VYHINLAGWIHFYLDRKNGIYQTKKKKRTKEKKKRKEKKIHPLFEAGHRFFKVHTRAQGTVYHYQKLSN
jgi:hypothetical protein